MHHELKFRRRLLEVLGRGGTTNRWPVNIGLWAASVLLVCTGIIHLHLWDTGYRHIATIGPLFFLQGITAFVIALGLSVFRRMWSIVLAAGFATSTIAGFLLSVEVGLFGFQDSWSAPYAGLAFGIEIAAVVVLVVGGMLVLHSPPSRSARSARSATAQLAVPIPSKRSVPGQAEPGFSES